MNSFEKDLEYERKMDRISEQIEELMMDAIITALQKIKRRNLIFSKSQTQSQTEPFPF